MVRVVADQFSWNIHYAGADGQFGRVDMALITADNPLGLDRRDLVAKDDLTFINQMTVPVNRPVLVRLTSKDVIHSFGINEMRVKQDASPGFDTPVWFVPTVTTAERTSGLRVENPAMFDLFANHPAIREAFKAAYEAHSG